MSLETLELIKTIISYAIPILGLIMFIIWNDPIDFDVDLSINIFAVSLLLFIACISAYFPVRVTIREKEIEKYNTCISNDYEVYLKGSKVEYPDKLNTDDYKFTFDDKKKEVILSD